MCNIINKIITENFPNLEKSIPIEMHEASRTPNRPDQNRSTPWHIIIKTTNTETQKRILKAVREKKQHTKVSPSKSQQTSQQTLKKRRAWGEIFWALNENNFNPRILYPAKLSFKINGAIKVFHDKEKLKQYVTTRPTLQKILQGILHTEGETQHNHERAGSTKYRKRKSKKIESNLNLGIHNQTFKQESTLNVNGLNSPIKRHLLTNWVQKKDPTIYCLQETHLTDRNKHRLRMKGCKNIYQANDPQTQARVAILISDKVDLKHSLIK
jgi:hypothetical protein